MSKNVNFSAKQLKVIEWLANPYDHTPPTQEKLAQELRIRPETITRWKRDQAFNEATIARARELLGDDLPKIYDALKREAIAGSFQHIKLALEITGEHTDRIEGSIKVDGSLVILPPQK